MTCLHAATEVADACIEHCPICQRDEIERLRAALGCFMKATNGHPDRWVTGHIVHARKQAEIAYQQYGRKE